MNISLDRRAAARRLYEELLDAGQGGNAPLMGQDLMNFLRGIEDPQHTFVKAIVSRAGVELPVVFNLKPEFYFANGQQVIGIEMLQPNDEHETTVQQWIADMTAIGEGNAEDGGYDDHPVKMFSAGQAGDMHSFSLIYDDRTNVMFIVRDLAGTGYVWADIRDWVKRLGDAAVRREYGLNGHLDKNELADRFEQIVRIVNGLDRGEVNRAQAADDAVQFITMFSPNKQNELENQYDVVKELINGKWVNPDKPNARIEKPAAPGEEVLDDIIDQLDDPPEKPAEPEKPEKPAEPEKPEKPAEPPPEWPQQWNGLTIQKAFNAQDFVNGDYKLAAGDTYLFTPFSEEQIKQQLAQFPQDAVRQFAQDAGQVAYFQIPQREPDATDPTHKELRYFFLVWPDGTFVWKQVKKGHSGVFSRARGRMTPADFLSMFRQKPMKAWKSFIYRYTQEAWKQEAVKVVYVGADKFFQQPDGKVVAAPGAAPIVNKAADAEPEEDKPVDRRTLIANAIYRRLRKEGVGKIGFDRRVATKPPPGRKTGKTIIQGRDYDHIHRRWIGNDRAMTDDDARRLADNYDNWEYFGKNYRTRQALVRLTNPDTLTPEEIEAARPIPLKLATHEAPKFEDETLAAAQAEIDVAVKALKRMIHVDLRPMDGGGGGVDFVVKIPGAGGRALDADRSEEFLKRFKLWDGVLKPIFDKTADAVGSLGLEVQFVNKIEK